MRQDFGRIAQRGHQSLFENRSEAVSVSYRLLIGKQQVHFYQQPVSRVPETEAVVTNSQVAADLVQVSCNLVARFWIRIVHQALHGLPYKTPTGPQNIDGY